MKTNLILSGYGGGDIPSMQIYENSQPILSRYEKNCSFICKSQNAIFGITQDSPTSKIYIFSSDGKQLLGSRMVDGAGLCHITYIEKSSLLVGSCYISGNIFWVKVEKNRFVGEVSYHHQGSEPGRAHCVAATQDESLLLSANIMQDRIYSYEITANDLKEAGYLQLPTGIGPRHILPVEKGTYYVITEYSNEILLIKDNTLKSTYTTLSDDFDGVSNGSSLCRSKGFLYAANRGEDTIAVFKINPDFTLVPIGRFACGDFPRHIALINDNTQIVSANQHGNCFSIFTLDEKTGMAVGKITEIPFHEPSFVM